MNHLAVARFCFFLGKVPKVYEVDDTKLPAKLHRFLMMRFRDARLTVRQLMGEGESTGKSIRADSPALSTSAM